MRWIWLRHGETEANTARQYLGHTDSPLTQHGMRQIDHAIEQLSNILPPSPNGLIQSIKLFTSDLGRTTQMASRIGAHLGVIPVQCAELRELYFGQWEGLTYEKIMAADQPRVESWYDNVYDIAPPGGETLLEMGARIDRWVADVLKTQDAEATIIVVSHNGPIRWFMSRFVLGDEHAYWQVDGVDPGGLFVTDYVDSRWK